MMNDLLEERGGQKLNGKELQQVGSILLQGSVAQQLDQMKGKEAGIKYTAEALTKERKAVEKTQQVKRTQCRSRERGMGM